MRGFRLTVMPSPAPGRLASNEWRLSPRTAPRSRLWSLLMGSVLSGFRWTDADAGIGDGSPAARDDPMDAPPALPGGAPWLRLVSIGFAQRAGGVSHAARAADAIAAASHSWQGRMHSTRAACVCEAHAGYASIGNTPRITRRPSWMGRFLAAYPQMRPQNVAKKRGRSPSRHPSIQEQGQALPISTGAVNSPFQPRAG
jgi:hypothetical protein